MNLAIKAKGQICTIEDRLIRKVVGSISDKDGESLDAQLRQWLSL